MAFNYSPKIVTDGLVFYLDAANTKSYVSGSTSWYDLSGNDNNGTLINGPTFDSGNRGSIVLDGINNYVDTSFSGITGTNPRTICIWFNPRISQNNNILGYGNLTNLQMFDVLLYQGTIGIHLFNSNNEANTTYEINKWQYVTFTFLYPKIQCFMNGEYKNQYSNNSINTGNINKLNIGKGTYSPYFYFDGNIGNVSIYNRALSSTEIQQNYNTTKSRFGL